MQTALRIVWWKWYDPMKSLPVSSEQLEKDVYYILIIFDGAGQRLNSEPYDLLLA